MEPVPDVVSEAELSELSTAYAKAFTMPILAALSKSYDARRRARCGRRCAKLSAKCIGVYGLVDIRRRRCGSRGASCMQLCAKVCKCSWMQCVV